MAKPEETMWARYIDDYMKRDNENEELCSLVKSLKSGDVTLLHIVEKLGPYLTSQDVSTRVQGTQLLSGVLQDLPATKLSQKEAEVLLTFFCDRLRDHHSVMPPVLQGLLALVQLDSLTGKEMVDLLNTIFREVQAQTLKVNDRKHIYDILSYILLHFLQDIVVLGPEFVCGLIQIADGEKDPRNLLTVFNLVRVTAQNISLGTFSEELFDIVACYFPVDFTPPPNDVHCVTQEQLVEGLRGCFSASSRFAQYSLPLLLEKATSSITSAKVDALLTLTVCAEVYGAQQLVEYSALFWSAIRREVCSGASETATSASLKALTAISNTLAGDVMNEDKQFLKAFADEIFDDCRSMLVDQDLRLLSPACRLLQTFALSADLASKFISSKLIPLLLQQLQKQTSTMKKGQILDALVHFIKAMKDSSQSGETSLSAFKEELYTVMMSTFTEVHHNLRQNGIVGIVGLLSIPGMISDLQRHLVLQQLTNMIIDDVDSIVRKRSIEAAAYCSVEWPETVLSVLLPTLTKALSDVCQPSDHGEGVKAEKKGFLSISYLLMCIASISSKPVILKSTVPVFLSQLDSVAYKTTDIEENLKTVKICCDCLQRIVAANSSDDESRHYLSSFLISSIINLLLRGATSEQPHCVITEWDAVYHMSSVISIIVCSLSKDESNVILNIAQGLFLDGTTEKRQFQDLPPIYGIDPFDTTCSEPVSNMLQVPMVLICSLPQDIILERADELLNKLVVVSCKSPHQNAATIAAKCIAGILNKMPPGSHLDACVNQIFNQIEEYSTSGNTEQKIRHLMIWLWLTKAVIMRSHSKQSLLLKQLVVMLEDVELAEVASSGVGLLVADAVDVMTTNMHARITMLYKQRIFTILLPLLKQGFHQTLPEKKKYYLVALSHILEGVPKQVLQAELPELLTMLLQSLDLPEDTLWISTLDSLYDLTHHAPEILSSHIDDLLPRLLLLSNYKQKMKVRVCAIRCIGALTLLPAHIILPQMKKVALSLTTVLNDHKRLVRKEAVIARQEWLLLDS